MLQGNAIVIMFSISKLEVSAVPAKIPGDEKFYLLCASLAGMRSR
jgi:hypothetical protein